MSKIRLMIIDDSLFFRTFLTRQVGREPSIEIVGSFGDPVEASRNIADLRPDVIALDMEMPRMRGDQFLKTVMPKHPTVKAIVISALSGNVFDAMHNGAIDFVGKPGSTPGFDETQFIPEIIQKIKVASKAHTHRYADHKPMSPAAQLAARPAAPSAMPRPGVSPASSKSLIAIGASTGGTEAVIEVVRKFPSNTPGVVIVQHMPPVFTKMWAERVDRICAMKVSEAKNGDRIQQGTVLIAPGGNEQLYVRQDANGYYVYIMPGAKVSGHCPSVDVMFESVAKVAGKNSVGVILTGMGADGAKGLTEMRKMGAYTISQDEESCVVYGMPMEAVKRGGVCDELPLSEIGDNVLKRFSGR
ncbi:MAG: chemotaxis response regulator protein-glutamate methylesterase [Oscillospiraceae bacterium]|nr:chemotaxis response regulator protein-glutamate methylesterase [Oscillospiraceae bacterium]